MNRVKKEIETRLMYDPVRFIFVLAVTRKRTEYRGPFWPFLFPKITRQTRHYLFTEGSPGITNAESMRRVKWPQIRTIQCFIRDEYNKNRHAGRADWPENLPAVNSYDYEGGLINRKMPRMLNPPPPPGPGPKEPPKVPPGRRYGAEPELGTLDHPNVINR